MPSDLPFEYLPRWMEVDDYLKSPDPTKRAEGIRLLEERDRQIEEYLKNLPTGGTGPGGEVQAAGTNDSGDANTTTIAAWSTLDTQHDVWTMNGGDTLLMWTHVYFETPAASLDTRAPVQIRAAYKIGSGGTWAGHSYNSALDNRMRHSPEESFHMMVASRYVHGGADGESVYIGVRVSTFDRAMRQLGSNTVSLKIAAP